MQRYIFKNKIGLFLACSIIATILIGCRSETTEQTNLILWVDSAEGYYDYFSRAIINFENQNQNLSVTVRHKRFQDLKPAFIGSLNDTSAPDVILIVNDWLGELNEANLLLKLNKHLTVDDDFIDISIEAFDENGSLYALPWSIETLALFYNKKFVSQPPKSFQQISYLSGEIEKMGAEILMYENKNFYFHAPFYFGVKQEELFCENKIQLDIEALIESIEYAISLERDKKIISPETNAPAMINLFTNNKLAFIISGPWHLHNLIKQDIDFGLAKLPMMNNDKHPIPFIGVRGFAINRQTKSKDRAIKLVEFLSSKEQQQIAMKKAFITAPRTSLYKNSQAISKPFFLQASEGVLMPKGAKMKHLWENINWLLARAFEAECINEIRKLAIDALDNLENALKASR